MKDPLRYYIAEAWMVLFYCPNPEKFGQFTGKYRSTKLMRDKLKVEEVGGKRCLVVKSLEGNRVAYPINPDFFLDYGIRCEDEAGVEHKGNEWAAEFNALADDFKAIKHELEHA